MKQILLVRRILSFFICLVNLKESYGAVSLCHATLTGNSGTFTSPSYPSEQSSNQSHHGGYINCEWTIEVERGKGIQLKFGDFDIDAPLDECDKGEVEIFSWTGKQRVSLDKYCPGNKPNSALISNNTATVVFRRPVSEFKGRGFLISYITTTPGETIADFVTCSDTGNNHSNGESYTITCPSGCASLDHHIVRGKLPYREDSYLCRAAIHAGVISDEFGGRFRVHRQTGEMFYFATTANNITTLTGSMADFQFTFPSVENCHDEIKLRPSQFSASSHYTETTDEGRIELWLPRKALITNPEGAWSPKDTIKPQWLQIDLRRIMNITGVLISGSRKPHSWTKTFTVQYSTNNITWHPYVVKEHRRPKLFAGNINFYGKVRNNFIVPRIIARYVRIYPTLPEKDDFIQLGLKAALTGCDPTKDWIPDTPKWNHPTTPVLTTTTKSTVSSQLQPTVTPRVSNITTQESKHDNKKDGILTRNFTKAKEHTNMVTVGDGIKIPASPSDDLNAKNIIIIAIVTVLAVTSILLAALVLFLVRKRRKVPKYMTAIPDPNSQNNITYHTSIGMPYAPTNNNIRPQKSKKTNRKVASRTDEAVAHNNGVSYANSFARENATIPYDQACRPIVNSLTKERRIELRTLHSAGQNNEEAKLYYPQNEGNTCAFTSDDDDHEYQVIPDPVNEYNKLLTYSSNASTGSSIGARSKLSDTNRWQNNTMMGGTDSLNSADSREFSTFSSHRGMLPSFKHTSSNSIHSQPSRKTPPVPSLNPIAAQFSLRSGSNRKSPGISSAHFRQNISPQRFSNSSNGSSSSHNAHNLTKYHTPVPGVEELPLSEQASNFGTTFNYPQEQGGRENSLQSPADMAYPLVFSPAPNNHTAYHNKGHTPSLSNGNACKQGTNDFIAGVTLPNRINQRCDYDQLYRKKNSTTDGTNSVVSMTTNTYDQLNLNTAV